MKWPSSVVYSFRRSAAKHQCSMEIMEQKSLSIPVEIMPSQPDILPIPAHGPRQAGHLIAMPKHRYWFPALVGVLAPIGISAFYITIYRIWILGAGSVGDIQTGPGDAKSVFYRWFVVAVFALSLAEYGLAGTEAGLLMNIRHWQRTQRPSIIRLHADKTWSGPSGWTKGLALALSSDPPTTWLPWLTLTVAMVTCYVGIPLSGLTIELLQGYALGTAAPTVLGVNSSTFNGTEYRDSLQHATLSWKTGRAERPPGRGAIYTRTHRDTPIASISSEGVPEIFMAPQSDTIISGRAWGLVARYNCSVVTRTEDFRLYQLKDDTRPYGGLRGMAVHESGGDTEFFFSQNWTQYRNVDARMEVATSFNADRIFVIPEYRKQPFERYDSPTDRQSETEWLDYPGLDEEMIIEVVLWQTITPPRDFRGPDASISSDVGTIVPGLEDGEKSTPAIAVTCTSASAVGHARIDGLTRTFSDFSRENVALSDHLNSQPLGSAAYWHTPAILPFGALSVFMQDIPLIAVAKNDWIQGLFSSVVADQSVVVQDRRLFNESNDDEDALALLRLLTADELRRSVVQAFGSYATELMYRGNQDAALSGEGGPSGWTARGLKAAYETDVLRRGVIPPGVVIAMLVIWTAVSVPLTVWYGFRMREVSTLDSWLARQAVA